MTDIQQAEYDRLLALQTARMDHCIPLTEDDRQWFAQNKRSKNGQPRRSRVRDAIASDHPLFQVGGVDPSNYITIIFNGGWQFIIVLRDEVEFGPVVNADEYANWRIDHIIKNERHARIGGVYG